MGYVLFVGGRSFVRTITILFLGDYDWWRVLRFSLYGGLFVAPTLYGWIKVSIFKKSNSIT